MKPPPFEYYIPDTLEEALTLLADLGDDARPLAGGQSLVPAMNFRLAQPAVLVDLNRLNELSTIRRLPQGEGLRIGAMARQRAVERSPEVKEQAPLLFETMPYIAHPQIRNRGTIGGSLAHADPAAELPAVAIALDARLKVQRKGGERWVQAPAFFRGLFEVDLRPGELLTEVHLPPLSPRSGTAFAEIARRHGDYALSGAVARVTLDEKGQVSDCRLVLFAVGETPVEARTATRALHGALPTEAALLEVAMLVDEEFDPISDIHATAAYRRHLSKVLARRVLSRAAARAANGSEF